MCIRDSKLDPEAWDGPFKVRRQSGPKVELTKRGWVHVDFVKVYRSQQQRKPSTLSAADNVAALEAIGVPTEHAEAIANLLRVKGTNKRTIKRKGILLEDVDTEWPQEIKRITGHKVQGGHLRYSVLWTDNTYQEQDLEAVIRKGTSHARARMQDYWASVLGTSP